MKSSTWRRDEVKEWNSFARMGSRFARHWLVASGLCVGTVGLASLVSLTLRQRQIVSHGGCWSDAVSYCAMAEGHPGHRPFSERPLVPFTARLLRAATHLSLVGSFRVVAIVGFLLTAGAIAALTGAVALRAGVPRNRATIVSVVAVGLWIVTPYALRFALAAPTLTDALATSLVVGWLAAFIAPLRPPQALTLSPTLAALAVLAREVAVATILVTCIVAILVRATSRGRLLANCAAALLALVVDLAQPHRASSVNLRSLGTSVARYWLEHPQQTIRALLIGVGFALIALIPTVPARVAASVKSRRHLAVLVPAGIVPIVLAFGGLDFARLASPATPVLSVLLAFYLVLAASDVQRALVLTAVLICYAEWAMFGTVTRTGHGYVSYYGYRHQFSGLSMALLAGIAAITAGLDLRRRPAVPARSEPPGT